MAITAITSQLLEEWYELYRQHFVDMGLKLGYGKEEVRDLVNQFFLGMLEKNNKVCSIENPKAYLTVAFKRKLIDYHRSKVKGKFVDAERVEEELEELSVQDVIEQEQSNAELVDKMRAAYKKLPPRCQTVIRLKFYEELTTDQIAEQTGLSKRTVYNNLFEGIKLLRSELNKTNPSIKVAALFSVLPVVAISTTL